MEKYEQRQKEREGQKEEQKEKKEVVTTDKDQRSCLFCNLVSESVEENLEHMQKKHSFFISSEEQCIDKQGLLKHLGEKINKGLMCLYCENAGGKGFKNRQALQDHMIDKGHCFMNTESYDEYMKFYDFSSQL